MKTDVMEGVRRALQKKEKYRLEDLTVEELSELLQSLNPEGYELEDLDDIDGLEEGLRRALEEEGVGYLAVPDMDNPYKGIQDMDSLKRDLMDAIDVEISEYISTSISELYFALKDYLVGPEEIEGGVWYYTPILGLAFIFLDDEGLDEEYLHLLVATPHEVVAGPETIHRGALR